MSFAGQVVWVTGASAGIGAALARSFAARGARLVLSARRAERLEAVRAGLPPPGTGEHLAVSLDLADPASLAAAVESVLARCRAVDVLVHCGGVSQRALVRDTSLAVDRRIMEVNYFGAVALTKAVLPSMLARRSGRIVVVTSLVGKIGTPLRSGYSASKHALHGFFDSLRAEVFRDGVRVTVACPGFIHTDVSINALTGDGAPQGTMDDAQARGMSPEDCAEAIVRAVERGKDEVLVGGREVWAVRLHRFFPGLFRRLIRTAKVT